MKLDLGGGENPREGYESVDFYAPNAKWKVNLFEFPWPWEDGSVEALNASHFIEHIPMLYVAPGSKPTFLPESEDARDLFVRFMDECWRVLQDGGELSLIWPALQSVRAFQDPTHRRFIPLESLNYFNPEWRSANKLEHYLGKCNFAVTGAGYVPTDGLLANGQFYNQEAMGTVVSQHWNVTVDYAATLKAVKSVPQPEELPVAPV